MKAETQMKKTIYGLYIVAADEWEFFLVTENLKLVGIYNFFLTWQCFFSDKTHRKLKTKIQKPDKKMGSEDAIVGEFHHSPQMFLHIDLSDCSVTHPVLEQKYFHH